MEADPGLRELTRREPRAVTDEQLQRVHSERHIATMRAAGALADRSGEGSWLDPDTWLGPGTLEAADHSAGAAVEAAAAVVAGKVDRAVCLCRPPGHHATVDRAMGFCIFNNIAVAAAEALAQGCARVAVLDFDVHHGNGTQDIFYARPDVLYMSSHQWPLYPGTGAASERGVGAGEGYTLNIPLPAGTGEAEYLAVFDEVFAPALREYQPELILVSAGFDAHVDDPLAEMRLTAPAFGVLADRIRSWSEELCGGRSAWCLEGGYSLTGLAESVAEVLRRLL